MNVLYHTYNKVHSTAGGTERTTITMAAALIRLFNARCFSIYEASADTPKEECFLKEFRWAQSRGDEKSIQFLRNIIAENGIDCVIIQGAFIQVPRFRAAVFGMNCKVILAHHFEPRWELMFERMSKIIKYRPKSFKGFARWVKRIIMHPLIAIQNERRLSVAYRVAYENSDYLVLLCRAFIKPYGEFAGIHDTSKYRVIPNGLSFPITPYFDKLSKKKVILIVSRFDEPSKRLALAIRIWARVKKDPVAVGWVLQIVGHGNDRPLYEKIIRKEGIPDVFIAGRQDPFSYYREASIFFMTSKSESWGLTLTEAQQMGTVPIAFDAFASIGEIITDGKNGAVIREGDVDGYVNRTKELMTNNKLRHQMAEEAIRSSERFSHERIAGIWWKLLTHKKLLKPIIDKR